MRWSDIVEDELVRIDQADQRRAPRDLLMVGPRGWVQGTETEIVSFASNDYLGLTTHPAVTAAAAAAACEFGAGSGSARLIVGSRALHSDLEAALADWRETASATLFPTGFAANLGVMTTFGAHGSVICSDELNHASIIDGCRQAKADVRVYPHRDVAAVDEILSDSGDGGIVVSDSVFSMDGDLAPIVDLATVCAEHNALLVLDDAHAVRGLRKVLVEALPVERELTGPVEEPHTGDGGLAAAGGLDNRLRHQASAFPCESVSGCGFWALCG
jgi:8-amino-7-oxononanoate synthase